MDSTSPAPAGAGTVAEDLAGLDALCTASPDWKTWRQQALSALPLEAVYGPWLTGQQSGEGWPRSSPK